MLRIKSTPHQYGISLQGDYQDLNVLYESLGRYLEFYQSNGPSLHYHQYEYLLSLNYDIRHAFMGTRDITCVPNNAEEVGVIAESFFQIPNSSQAEFRRIRENFSGGNLYFSVNILYPLVFHYLFTLDSILDEYLYPNEQTKLPQHWKAYTSLQANADQAQLRLLTSLLWNHLTELFGESTAETLYHFFSEKEYFLSAPPVYIDALLHYQMVHFKKMPPETRKAFHLAGLFEIMGAEELSEEPELFERENSSYNAALRLLAEQGFNFPSKETFFDALEKAVPKGQPLYEDTFDHFLEDQYGMIDDEDREPDW